MVKLNLTRGKNDKKRNELVDIIIEQDKRLALYEEKERNDHKQRKAE